MDKNKKELLKNFKDEQRKKFIESLPMSIENFTDLFDYLDETMDECDDELSLTRQFLMENKLPIDEVIEWLETNGGYCDCEVLANIEDLFEDVI